MKQHASLRLFFILGCLLLTGAALTSCAPDKTAPELKATRTPIPEEPSEQTATPATASGAVIATVAFTDTGCLNCHSNQDILKAMTSGQVVAASVERWQQLWIDPEPYSGDAHALINCTACHGGDAAGNFTTAHTDLIVDPSANPETTCGTCHTDIAPAASHSLHYTQAGIKTALHTRSSDSHAAELDQIIAQNCPNCQATCGSCHVSQTGGAMLNGHVFVRTPPADQTCLNCHGSQEGKEYYGLNEGVAADVHAQAGMTCLDCHDGDQMHGLSEPADATSRYQGPQQPSCESCHTDQVGVGSGILLHELHGTEILPCQACHSEAYVNCTNCSLNPDGSYTVASSTMGLYLGRNTTRSMDRPWRYVPVQHLPFDANSLDAFGSGLLDQFLNSPSWVYTTPHNIQRETPQTQTCTSCHSNNDLFLTVDDLAEIERGGANLEVIVETAPPLPENWIQVMSQIAQHGAVMIQPTGESTGANFWATPVPTEVSGSASYWAGATNTPVPPTAVPDDEADSEAPVDEEAEESEESPVIEEESAADEESEATPTATGAASSTSFWAGTTTPPAVSSSFWEQQ